MIGDYLVVALVFGIVGSFAAIIHHSWLRDASKQEGQQRAPAKNEGTGGISTPKPSAQRQSPVLSKKQVSGRS